MKFRNSVFGLISLLSLFVAHAQDQRQEPGSAKVPVQKEADDVESGKNNLSSEDVDSKKSYGFVRVWNFTDGNPERLAVGLLKQGKDPTGEGEAGSQFVWLGRGMVRSETKSYLPVPIGTYQLVAAPEKVQNFTGSDDENKPLTAQDNLVKGTPSMDVSKDVYQTIILTGAADKIQINEIKDSDIPKQPKHLRAMNFTKEYKPSVISLSGEKQSVVWPEVGGSPMDSIAPGGTVNYEVSYKKPSGSLVRKSLEISFAGSRSVTILMYYDRYGRFACRAVSDAPGS